MERKNDNIWSQKCNGLEKYGAEVISDTSEEKFGVKPTGLILVCILFNNRS